MTLTQAAYHLQFRQKKKSKEETSSGDECVKNSSETTQNKTEGQGVFFQDDFGLNFYFKLED